MATTAFWHWPTQTDSLSPFCRGEAQICCGSSWGSFITQNQRLLFHKARYKSSRTFGVKTIRSEVFGCVLTSAVSEPNTSSIDANSCCLFPSQPAVRRTPHSPELFIVRRCGLAWRTGPALLPIPCWPSTMASCNCSCTDTTPASWCPRYATCPSSWRTTPPHRCCPWRSASGTRLSI